MARSEIGGNSHVTYPLFNQWVEDDIGQDWLKSSSNDWSTKSPFGDYDFMFGLHAENTIANKVNVGVTYLNHHHSDIAKGGAFGLMGIRERVHALRGEMDIAGSPGAGTTITITLPVEN